MVAALVHIYSLLMHRNASVYRREGGRMGEWVGGRAGRKACMGWMKETRCDTVLGLTAP